MPNASMSDPTFRIVNHGCLTVNDAFTRVEFFVYPFLLCILFFTCVFTACMAYLRWNYEIVLVPKNAIRDEPEWGAEVITR
jgi:hypothetical protein